MSTEVATALFGDRLADAVERKRSQLLVGLDPRPDLLPVELVGDVQYDRAAAAGGCARFCRGIVDAVAPAAVAVKVAEYLRGGVRLVWILDPEKRQATVHRQGVEVRTIAEGEELDGEDVVPGFRCALRDLFD